jgi:hypothetical protein
MLTLFFEDAGLLHEDTRILSVGAGHETVLFWLANRVAKVVATDIYGEGTFSEGEADRTMLTDAASFSPYPYRESHLEVRHMDAKQLEFPDDSFDAVFTLSSIEHFGSWGTFSVQRGMGRVLGLERQCVHHDRVLPGSQRLTRSVRRPRQATGGRTFGSMRIFTRRHSSRIVNRVGSSSCNHSTRHRPRRSKRDHAGEGPTCWIGGRDAVPTRRCASQEVRSAHPELDFHRAGAVQAVGLGPSSDAGRPQARRFDPGSRPGGIRHPRKPHGRRRSHSWRSSPGHGLLLRRIALGAIGGGPLPLPRARRRRQVRDHLGDHRDRRERVRRQPALARDPRGIGAARTRSGASSTTCWGCAW